MFQQLAQASNSARMQLLTPLTLSLPPQPEPLRPRPLIRQFLDQAYDTFNVFGLTPEQMTNRYKSFLAALSGFSDAAVTHGFQIWLANETTMPVPASIAKPAAEYDRMVLNSSEPFERARPVEKPAYRPVWDGVPFAVMTPEARKALGVFLARLPVTTRDLYMQDTGWPAWGSDAWGVPA
jgi:hypothetical protein